MLEILQYATSGFWVFIGCLLLAAVVAQAVVGIIGIVFGKKP